MPAHGAPELREILILLFAAGVAVPLVQRFRVSPVVGFLAVGILLGRDSLGFLAGSWPALRDVLTLSDEGVRFLGELGVIFLLFTVGLELSLSRLSALRRLVFGLGALQVVASALVIGMIARFFGNSPPAAMIIGLALALSSTAIVVQLLVERGRLGSVVGRTSFAVLLFQDLAVVPILLLVGVMAGKGQGSIWLELGHAAVVATLAITAILVLGRLLVRPFFRFVGATRSPEAFMAAAMLTVIGTATLTAFAGLSLALGAFLAGLVFADTEYRHEIEVTIAPFKGLLLGVFFMSVGMGLSIRGVLADPVWVVLSVVGLLAIKATLMGVLAWRFGLSLPQAAEVGLTVAQGGEFAFIILGAALAASLVTLPAAQFIFLVAGLSMVLAPAIVRLGEAIGHRLQVRRAQSPAIAEGLENESLEGHVIVVGYGRVGRLIVSLLNQQRMPQVALDLDPMTVGSARKAGQPVYYGSAARDGMLVRVALAKASAIVITVAEKDAAESIVRAVRQASSSIPIIVRARDSEQAGRLYRLGANVVVPETTEASLQLGEAMLRGVGLPAEAARQIIDERREIERLADDETRRKHRRSPGPPSQERPDRHEGSPPSGP